VWGLISTGGRRLGSLVVEESGSVRNLVFGAIVARMERVCVEAGYPKTIRVDQSPEVVSRDLDLWADANGARTTTRFVSVM